MKIVIIGCGFAGLSLANMLSESHQITIFDKFKVAQPVGAGIMLQPSSQIILNNLGYQDKLQKEGEIIDKIVGLNQHKKQVFLTQYKDFNENYFGLGIQRGSLFTWLYQSLLKKDNVRINLDTEINHINDLNGYDLVVIANGTHSTLRQQLPLKQKYNIFPYGCLWTCIEDDHTTHGTLRQYVKSSKEMFGLLPSGYLNNQRMLSIFWSLPVKEKNHFDKNIILQKMKQHHNDEQLLNKINNKDLAFAIYGDVWLEKFHHKNIVVIGDAAHGMSPQLGQGANMAILDSYFLAQSIEKNKDINIALEEYSKIRKPHVDFYTQASKFLTPLFQSDCSTYGFLRDHMFTISQKLPFSRSLSSQILAGKKLSWFSKKELSYELKV